MEELQLAPLDVKMEPAKVDVPNLDEVVATVSGIVEQYGNVPVSAKTQKEAKTTKAELNKLKDQVQRVRIDTRAALLADWEPIEEKLKGLETTTKNASDTLKIQLDDLELKVKADRRERIESEINKISNEYSIDPKRIKFDDTWTQATRYKKFKGIESDIREQFDKLKAEDELYMLRVAQVEQQAKELGIEPGGYVRLLHSEDLSEVLAKMKLDVENREAELKARQEMEAAAAEHHAEVLATATKVGDKHVDTDTGEVVPETIETPRHTHVYTVHDITAEQDDYLQSMLGNILNRAQVKWEAKEV
jgi:hypothetical protein